MGKLDELGDKRVTLLKKNEFFNLFSSAPL